jgi:hypothetical protein
MMIIIIISSSSVAVVVFVFGAGCEITRNAPAALRRDGE